MTLPPNTSIAPARSAATARIHTDSLACIYRAPLIFRHPHINAVYRASQVETFMFPEKLGFSPTPAKDRTPVRKAVNPPS